MEMPKSKGQLNVKAQMTKRKWITGMMACPPCSSSARELGQGADARVGQGMMEEWVITNVKIQSSNECQSQRLKEPG